MQTCRMTSPCPSRALTPMCGPSSRCCLRRRGSRSEGTGQRPARGPGLECGLHVLAGTPAVQFTENFSPGPVRGRYLCLERIVLTSAKMLHNPEDSPSMRGLHSRPSSNACQACQSQGGYTLLCSKPAEL